MASCSSLAATRDRLGPPIAAAFFLRPSALAASSLGSFGRKGPLILCFCCGTRGKHQCMREGRLLEVQASDVRYFELV